MAGKPVHVEIGATDSQRARRFYGDLFGWEFQSFEGSPNDYSLTQFSDSLGGAVYRSDDGPRVLVYFDVDEIEAGRARVRDLGGTSENAMPVPGMGWFAHCTDLDGNSFGLWQTDPDAQLPQG